MSLLVRLFLDLQPFPFLKKYEENTKRFEKILNKAVACQLTGSMSVYMTMSVHNIIFEAGCGLNGFCLKCPCRLALPITAVVSQLVCWA